MARFSFEEVDNYGTQKSNYFNLKDDGDTAVVRFLYKDINDVEGVVVHEVQVGNRTIDVECLKAYNEPVEKCPLCNANYPTKPNLYIPVYDEKSGESKIWKRRKPFFDRIAKLCTRYNPLVSIPVEIVRNGEAGDKKTTYELYPLGEKKDNAEIEDFPEIKAEGLAFQVKSKEDLEYYLQTGTFPEDIQNQSINRQNQNASRQTNQREMLATPIRRRPGYTDSTVEDTF